MRVHVLTAAVVVSLAACGLSACGSGSFVDGQTSGTVTLKGVLVLRDGSASNLGGVTFVDGRTGERVTTRSDGSFDFGTVPSGTIVLEVDDPLAPLALEGGDGGEERDGEEQDGEEKDGDDDGIDDPDEAVEDGDGDRDDVGDDDFDIEGCRDGDDVEIRVEIRDGRIEQVDVSHDERDEREVHVVLMPGPETDDPDAEGRVEVEAEGERGGELQVQVRHVAPGRVLELFVVAPEDGPAESQGVETVNPEGGARWRMGGDADRGIPFGFGSVADLQRYRIEVRDALTGLLLLHAVVPALPPPVVRDGDGEEHDGEDGVHEDGGQEGGEGGEHEGERD